MDRLTEYATERQYPYTAPDIDEDRRTLADSQRVIGDVLNHTREAVPRLSRETNRALAATPELVKPSDEAHGGTGAHARTLSTIPRTAAQWMTKPGRRKAHRTPARASGARSRARASQRERLHADVERRGHQENACG